jgi:hypothetical protein
LIIDIVVSTREEAIDLGLGLGRPVGLHLHDLAGRAALREAGEAPPRSAAPATSSDAHHSQRRTGVEEHGEDGRPPMSARNMERSAP